MYATYPTPRCSRSRASSPITPIPRLKEAYSPDPSVYSEREDLENFPWHELNTLARDVKDNPRRTEKSLQTICKRKLAKLDEAEHKTEGLDLLIASIKDITSQDWKLLILYFDEESELPDRARPWSHTEWRKWEVLEFLVKIADSYNDACEQAAKDDVKLVTEGVDELFLSFVKDVIELGEAPDEDGVIFIKEWEREGTRAMVDFEELCTQKLSDEEAMMRL